MWPTVAAADLPARERTDNREILSKHRMGEEIHVSKDRRQIVCEPHQEPRADLLLRLTRSELILATSPQKAN